ncbi:MAG: hypothetical protein AAFX51_16510, partial [Cyanobacteria bacterium J06636_28]
VLNDDRVLIVENVLPVGDIEDTESRTKQNDFQMPDDTLPAMTEKIQAIYHTHWRESSPALLTNTDIRAARAVGIPYVLCHVEFDQWDLWDPNGLHPWPLFKKHDDPKRLEFYTGWPWKWARADCLTLLRSYYQGMLGHTIKDFQRTATEEEFQERLRAGTWNDYDDNLGDQGLVKVWEGETNNFPFKLHDIVLMRLQGKMPHHVGIIVQLDPLQILHHLEAGRLSEIVPYGRARMRQTCSVWRIE